MGDSKPVEETMEVQETTQLSNEALKIEDDDLVSLDEYTEAAEVNTGLIASFKCEVARSGEKLDRKTPEDWEKALETQSKKEYK